MIISFSSRFLQGKQNGISIDTERFIYECIENGIEIMPSPDGEIFSISPNSTKFMTWELRMRQASAIFRGIKVTEKLDFLYLSQFSPIRYKTSQSCVNLYRVHDLFPLTHPEWFPKKAVLLFKLAIKRIAQNSFFICNSKYTQSELIRVLGVNQEATTVIPCSTNYLTGATACNTCQVCLNVKLPEIFILAVGTIEPRKNYSSLLPLYGDKVSNIHLPPIVLVGNRGWKSRKLEASLRDLPGVTVLQNICDYSLKGLYLKCHRFINISLDEGFDIPAHEANSLGCSMILSDIPVHLEYFKGRKEVTFVNPKDPAQISCALSSAGENRPASSPQMKSSGDFARFLENQWKK